MRERNFTAKRSRSRSPPSWHRLPKSPRQAERPGRGSHRHADTRPRNDLAESKWVADEDEFVLKQAKKKAEIRIREGRAKPIDWLAVVLAVVDPDEGILEDDGSKEDLEIMDPTNLVEGLSREEIRELNKEIDHYVVLEKSRENLKFWRAMKFVCKNRESSLAPSRPVGHSIGAVSTDVSRLLGDKSVEQLDTLEQQVARKLKSDDDIDVEYWEHLLDSIQFYRARADLKSIYQTVLDRRIRKFQNEQISIAEHARRELSEKFSASEANFPASNQLFPPNPEPMLRVDPADRGLRIMEEGALLESIALERERVRMMGFVPKKQLGQVAMSTGGAPRGTAGDASQTTNAMYDREVAQGVEEDEEVFAAEEELPTVARKKWPDGGYRPRKPKYFNRVQMGYDWNKYNQTHYDQDNPPPKVVQGYKFNIFYPELIDKTKAPTYRIERENGRKRGQSFAPAGEEDTCIIRFMSGLPYEDVAFRIVDKEWDYSARRERGFKSSFDKGILQLHFQFKKVFYRK